MKKPLSEILQDDPLDLDNNHQLARIARATEQTQQYVGCLLSIVIVGLVLGAISALLATNH